MGARPRSVFVVLVLVSTRLLAQGRPTTADQQTVVNVAQTAAVQALNFSQGDLRSLTRAQVNFTGGGWDDFIRRLQGFLDTKGAPTFTSSFVPSGNTTVLGEEGGIVHFRVPGTLVQSNQLGRTTYRAAIEVRAGGNPVRIERLEQITCLGASTTCQ